MSSVPNARWLPLVLILVGLAGPARASTSAPDAVLRGWALAIAQRDWPRVRALWGNHGADSGLSPQDFALRWRRLRHPRVTVEPGQEEGAAGSLYYTTTVTLTNGQRRWSAPVTLRRVNDVDGATPEQLRWHFDRSVREPWTNPR